MLESESDRRVPNGYLMGSTALERGAEDRRRIDGIREAECEVGEGCR